MQNITYIPTDPVYFKALKTRISLVYILLMGCASLILCITDWHPIPLTITAESVLAISLVINLGIARKIYRIKGYALREKDITYRTGLFFTSVTTVPFCKIQQVSIRITPLSRLFGLCSLDIVNGSQDDSNHITIPGLKQPVAEQIKATLIFNASSTDE